MEYIGFGDIEIKKTGSCGGVGCESCDCSTELYEDCMLYVSCSMIMLKSDANSEVLLLPMTNNKIHNIRFKGRGL